MSLGMISAYTLGLILVVAVLAWLISLAKRDVSMVDSLWSIFFIIAALSYWLQSAPTSTRAILVLALVAIWGLRLSLYITWRNWGEGEDARYQEIRANNDPGFAWKSLYIVFALQGLLAWIISAPLLVAITSGTAINGLDVAGMLLWTVGLVFEAGGDYQLARFKAKPDSKGTVFDRGLWRYTRHPNYFGDFCIWWGFFFFALAAGGWWTLFAPVLMTLLLLKVSGVALLEKDIVERRPGYREYIERTNAFFPWFPRPASDQEISL